MKQKTLGVIPARLHSTRLPRKMLADIHGKPLIYYTWRQAKKAKLLDEVVVATDSPEIRDVVRGFGGIALMTSEKLNTGSDRVAEAAKKFKGFRPDIVINIQGDEPMMPPEAIDLTVEGLLKDKQALMSTVATPLRNLKELNNPGIVKTVLDKHGYALYFSRLPIPYPRRSHNNYLKHLGIYGFRYSFLQNYVKFSQTPLELIESLEQLRALENGVKIRVGIGNFKRVEVNVAGELAMVRKLLSHRR